MIVHIFIFKTQTLLIVILIREIHFFLHGNTFYIKPRVANTKFGVKHYAGEIKRKIAVVLYVFVQYAVFHFRLVTRNDFDL